MSVSGGFDIRLATRSDEPEIRALVASVPMPGSVTVRFAREPDYFLGTTVMGDPCDVIVARRIADGALVGMACRAERRSFINGAEATTGYLGQIRIAPEFQGRWLVQRGARLVREMSREGLVYLGVIAAENPRARRVLVEHRPPAGLRAVRLSGLTTCAILLRPRRLRRAPGVEVRAASVAELPRLAAFLAANGPRRQLFPAYSLDDFTGGTMLRGLAPEDVMVAWRGGEIVGCMAAWDQAAYKQDIVEGYSRTLVRMRPVYDLAARLLGAQLLTKRGEAIPLAFGACVCVARDDPAVAAALVAACARHAYARSKAYLMLGFADEDPLLQVARRWLHVTYRSDIYAFSWSVDPAAVLDGRVPYVEVATL